MQAAHGRLDSADVVLKGPEGRMKYRPLHAHLVGRRCRMASLLGTVFAVGPQTGAASCLAFSLLALGRAFFHSRLLVWFVVRYGKTRMASTKLSAATATSLAICKRFAAGASIGYTFLTATRPDVVSLQWTHLI